MTEIWIVLGGLLLSAFFSSCEIVFTSFDKIKLLVWRKRPGILTKSLDLFFPRQDRFIITNLIGNNLANVTYSSVISIFLVAQGVPHWLVVVIATSILLTIGEIAPKTMAIAHANSMVRPYSLVLRLFYYLFFPVVESVSRIFGTIFPGLEDAQKRLLSGEALRWVIASEQKKLHPERAEIVDGLFGFSRQKVREIMTPRTDLVAAPVEFEPENIAELIMETGHSKILIYQEDIDHIMGYIHHLDLLNEGKTVREMVRPAEVVSEFTPVNQALKSLRAKETGMLVVIDEYGGVGGIVTIEDIVEELFGEIEDEYDRPRFRCRRISKNQLLVSGRMEIDDLNREFALNLEKEEGVETIGGWLITHAGKIPSEGEKFDFHGYRIRVIRADEKSVKLITLRLTLLC